MILETIDQLRQLTQTDVQIGWVHTGDEIDFNSINLDAWEKGELNEKGYIIWPAGKQVKWLGQKFIIPDHLKGYPLAGLTLRLALTWWAEDAKIFVNNQLVQEGDLFDSSSRILLTSSVQPGEEILVLLRLVSPGHDIGGLMKSRLIYERESNLTVDDDFNTLVIDPGFVADELTILYNYLSAFEPEKLQILNQVINQINWKLVSDASKFDRCLLDLREKILPLANYIKQSSLNLLGHAHLDMAWLWPVNETWDAAQRTFTSVINLQKDFPILIFGHTSPVLYEWIENYRPDLFDKIIQAFKAGKWELLGGMWVEPDVNLVSGESLVRQLLYGQRYFNNKFGEISQVAWLPDSFGFCWQLPQILQQSGIKYFVTGKLHWNATVKFSHGFFKWESPDGTQLLTLVSPPNVAGVMDTNPIIMTNYAIDWAQQTGLKEAFWLPGVGDHGGGPTRDMLAVQKQWQKSPFFPQSQFSKAIDYLNKISHVTEEIPIWKDELYLDFHRGCYTTHADQKWFNRRSEDLLYKAELWSSITTIVLEKTNNCASKKLLEEAWKKVLFNQFHDILPGTSITEVFVQANEDWQQVQAIGQNILNESLEAIASQISLPQPPQANAIPLVVFNSLNWQRSQVVECSKAAENCQVYNLEGHLLTSQLSSENNLLFLAENIPSIGYRVFWLCPGKNLVNNVVLSYPQDYILENQYLKVIINSKTGDIDSIFDKVNQKEVIKGKANQLQIFQDQGQYWDAWNIDPNYNNYPLEGTQLKSIEYLEVGPIQWKIRVIRQFRKSEFCQDYILQIHSKLFKIKTQVNWQETHVLIKASFPLTIANNNTTYEIPFAAIERNNNPETPEEKAKWEVPALRWADISDPSQDYGVSLLNDCKYGYDSQCDRLRLTLLRSPRWPDPECDRGLHHFTYAIYPHQGNWKEAKTVQQGYELNIPLDLVYLPQVSTKSSHKLPSINYFLKFKSDNLILSAFKPSEDNASYWILRCYESEGKIAQMCLENNLNLQLTDSVNLLEEPLAEFSQVDPWKIVSFQGTIIK
ncbi:glycosyl hydrolase 38 domain protein [Rippkaea orientalis PCC 8801]|uniref:Glycosyl hydrolase 38 domain protein n=1 Tax=Rippkaea orientalis (strain PCC 8801 / RF-1) TaxID=41431 RepID=B7K3R5_RIPO1|nr:alpha-mannosidase [Rippkaea orientalis]ACK66455.1 glycosyl hydrolase 38 domain protein [Rippkaea orientalis PCC 8801]